MKNKSILITACVAALVSIAPAAALAAPKTSPSPSASPHASPAAKNTMSPAPKETTTTTRAIPFHGMISAVDQSAKTFTITGKEKSRVFKITDKTVITKGATAATMKDITANEEVRGSYWKAADGSLEAKTVKIGPATDAEKADKPTKKKSTKTEAEPSASPKP